MYSSHRNRSKSSQKVVVIGAGPSGIGAARILHEQGLTPIVLEARDRIGGRIVGQKLYANLLDQDRAKDDANYVNIQMGANWIHGLDAEVNPFYPIAKKLNLELHQTSSDDEPGEDVLLFDGGHDGENDHSRKNNMIRVTKEEYYIVLKRYEWIKSKYFDDLFRYFDGEDYFHCKKGKVSLLEAFEAAIIASEASSELGPCSSFHRRCLNWLFDRVAIDMACPLQGVSVQNYMEGDSSGLYGEATIVNAGGMSSILHHLAHPEEEEGHAAAATATTALDIRLNMIVERIELIDSPLQDSNEEEEEVLSTSNVGSSETHVFPYLSSSSLSQHPTTRTSSTQKTKKMVRIICANNVEFIVDFVILTVPISLLTQPTIKENTMGKIIFSPEPPLAISRLSSTLKLGLMNLIWIWFPVTFWEEGFNFFGVARSSSSQQHSVAASKDGIQRYNSKETSAEDEEQEEERVDIVGIDEVSSRYPKLKVPGQEGNFLSCNPENFESSRAQLNSKYSPSVYSSPSSPLSPSSNKEHKSSNKSQQETEEEEETTFTTFLAPKVLDRYGNLQPVLMAQVIGPFAERCETIPEHVLADMVVQKLRKMFGDEKVPDAIGCARSTWRSDPFARGSWSYFPHHDTPVSASATAAADDKVTGVIGLDSISGVSSKDAGTTITDLIAVAASASAAASSSIVTTADYNSTAVGDTTVASSEDYSSSTSSSSSSSSTSSGSLLESGGDTLSMESSSLLPPNAAKGHSSAMTAATTNDMWDGHVLYAGEATNLQLRGSAHGAYLAGIKAAEAILKRIQEEEVQNI